MVWKRLILLSLLVGYLKNKVKVIKIKSTLYCVTMILYINFVRFKRYSVETEFWLNLKC